MLPRRHRAETILIIGKDERFINHIRPIYSSNRLRLLCVAKALEPALHYLTEIKFEKVIIDKRLQTEPLYETVTSLLGARGAEVELLDFPS